jgi:polo-like kinase 1
MEHHVNTNPERPRQVIEEKIIKLSGDVAVRRYEKGQFLGKGGFATVY